MNKTKIIFFSVLGVLFLIMILLFINGGKKKKTTFSDSDLDLKTENNTKFTYQDMMAKEEGNLFNSSSKVPYEEKEKGFNDLLAGLNKKDSTVEQTDAYSNEKEETVLKLEEEIKRMQEMANKSKQTTLIQDHPTPIVENKKVLPISASPDNNNKQIEAETVQLPKRRSEKLQKPEAENKKDIITGVIDNGNRDVRNGSTIRIRIIEPSKINGIMIEKNTLITGIASLAEERLNITVKSLISNGQLINCDLSVYDRDGVKGIIIASGNLNRDIKNDAANEAIEGVDKYIEVPMIGRVGTNILKRRVSEKSIVLNDNYQISLRKN